MNVIDPRDAQFLNIIINAIVIPVLFRHSRSFSSFPRRWESTTTVDLRLRTDRHKQQHQRGILVPDSQGFASAMDSPSRE